MKIYKKLLSEIYANESVLRLFLSKEEINACNQMLKLGYICKGRREEKNATISYYITKEGEKYLEQN